MPIAFETSSSAGAGGVGNTITVPAPAGIVDDDILIFGGGLGFAVGVPFSGVSSPGFNSIVNYFDGGANLVAGGVMWKRALSESGSYVITFDDADSLVDRTAVMVRISGAQTGSNPIEGNAESGRLSGSGATLDGVCPDIAITRTCLIVRFSIWEAGFSGISVARIAGVASTEREDRTFSFSATAIYTDDALVASAPGTMTLRMTQSNPFTCGGYISTIAIQELSAGANAVGSIGICNDITGID